MGEGSDLIRPLRAEAGRGSSDLRAGGGLGSPLESLAAAAATTARATGKRPAKFRVPISTVVLVSSAFRLNWIGGNPLPEMVTGVPEEYMLFSFSRVIGFWRIPDVETGS